MLSLWIVAGLIAVVYLGSRRLQTMRATQLLQRGEVGLLRVELRRCTEMRSHADGRGGLSYPQPVETRSLIWLCCELPLWSRCESIGLPVGCEGRLGQLQADEFDRHFTAAFRQSSKTAAARRSRTAAA